MIRQLKKSWPDAKAFGGTINYWHEADKARERKEKSRSAGSFASTDETKQNSANRQRTDRLRLRWSKLTESQKQLIRHRVSQSADRFVQRKIAAEKYDDTLVEMACLDELERSPIEL